MTPNVEYSEQQSSGRNSYLAAPGLIDIIRSRSSVWKLNPYDSQHIREWFLTTQSQTIQQDGPQAITQTITPFIARPLSGSVNCAVCIVMSLPVFFCQSICKNITLSDIAAKDTTRILTSLAITRFGLKTHHYPQRLAAALRVIIHGIDHFLPGHQQSPVPPL